MFKKILYPVDGSQNSEKALIEVMELATKFNSEVVLLHVCEYIGNAENLFGPDFAYMHEIEQHMKERSNIILTGIEQQLKKKGIKARTESGNGECGPVIVEMAEKTGCDLIVMGMRGLGSIKSVLLGSVSNYVAHHTKRPLMLVP